MASVNYKKSGNNGLVIAITVFSVLVFTAIVLGAYFLKDSDEPAALNNGSMTLDMRSDEKQSEAIVNPLWGRSVELMGFDNMKIKQDEEIFLGNVKENEDFVIKYEIKNTDTGETIFTTGLIESGKGVSFPAGKYLKPGKYNLSFVESPFWLNPDTKEYQPLTGGTNLVEIEILAD